MAKDDFDETDLADLSTADTKPAELSTEAQENIDAAMSKFLAKADGKDREEMSDVDEGAFARKAAQTRQRKLDEKEELAADGLENEDDPNEPVDEEVETQTASKQADQPETAAEQSSETPSSETAPDIDPNLRYFAETELGWSTEKIDRLVKADPELAAETIQTLASQSSDLSRQLLNPVTQQLAGSQTGQSPAQGMTPTPELDKFYANLTAFAEANGEDVAGFAKALNSELIEPVRKLLASNEAREQELLKTETLETFNGLKDKFADVYGKDDKSLTVVQNNARMLLGQVADQLRAGAKAAGKPITAKQAIAKAHLLVSADYRDSIVRKEIKEQVQKRAKQITAKPTQRKNPVVASSRSVEAASEALGKKAAELGIPGFDE